MKDNKDKCNKDSPSKYVASEQDIDTVSKGQLRYIGGKNEENLFYTIQKDKKQMKCYKEINSANVFKKLDLKGAKISEEQPEKQQTDLKLVLKSGEAIIFPKFDQDQKSEFKKSFLDDPDSPNHSKKSKSILKKFKSGVVFLAKAPIRISSGTITVLEKIGDGIRKTPDVMFTAKSERKKKIKKVPKNPTQGVYFGAESIVKEVAGAFIGLFTEPVKGAKKKGFKGATLGIGKGFAGLIFKPVAGTIDLVTHTARGVGTVPKVIYKDVFRIRSKKEKLAAAREKEIEKDHLELVYENDHEEVYIDKKRLSIQGVTIDIDAFRQQQEDQKEERLARVMMEVLHKIDDKESKALQVSPQEANQFQYEEEKDEEEDKEISEIMQYYQKDEDMSQQEEDQKMIEFLFVQNVPKKETDMSFDTIPFDDKPPDNFFDADFSPDEDFIEDLDSSVSSTSYNLELAVNKPIPLDDSNEFDVDEFNENDVRVVNFLAAHQGRDGRNGPTFQHEQVIQQFKAERILGNILDYESSEAIGFNAREISQHKLNKTNSLAKTNSIRSQGRAFDNQKFVLDPQDMSVSKSQIAWNVDQPITLDQIIPNEVKIKKPKNWEYPVVTMDLPYREIPELPDVMRPQDFEFKGKEYCHLKGQELIRFLENWSFVESKDDVRHFYAYKKGGKLPENEIIMKKLRTIGKEFLLKVGRSILSGNFNLTQLPFPIKASIPKSYFENIGGTPTCFYPIYLNLALKTQDPLQRFKFYIVSSIAYYYLTSPFAKPFNPIIGETFSGYYNDGSRSYCEQISHHPQVSYLLFYGPKEAYKVWGPSNFSANAGLNYLKIITKGWRKIQFADTKQLISNTFPNENYNNSLWGTTNTETVGTMDFIDVENDISCKLTFDYNKKLPSDYFEGDIIVKGKKVSRVNGTCLGWIEIDGQRYFDYRYVFPLEFHHEVSPLHSDFHYRADYLHLKQGYVDLGQKEKEALEKIQRNDAKLRKEYGEKHGEKHGEKKKKH